MKLSIIIPYYNTWELTNALLDCLAPQITEDVEVLLIDDGSKEPYKTDYEWCKVIRQENHGVSYSRNQGIELSKGDYIAFIDSDDLVADYYVKRILETIPFDYCEMSWKSIEGASYWNRKLNSDSDYLSNCSVWSRVFNRKFIGNVRFNTNKRATNDEDFTRHLKCRGKTNFNRKVITDYMYYYRTTTEGSVFKTFMEGKFDTKRIVYHMPVITKNMTYLVDEIKELDKFHEVWVLTNRNELPELEEYAQIHAPFAIRGMELRGVPTPLFTKVDMPVRAQVVIWTNKTSEIGGIVTFLYNFCINMYKYYDIVVLYNEMSQKQIDRLKPYVEVVQNNTQIPVVCDTLIVNRIIDVVPSNIKYKKIVQMVHTCGYIPSYHIPKERDLAICVSQACKDSYSEEENKNAIVLHNLLDTKPPKKALILVSATRLDTNEKGQKRMIKLANLMIMRGIPFVWLYFSNRVIDNTPPNLIWMNPTLDIKNYIAIADYCVQLSDTEAFCYTIVEALQCGVPVLCTDLPVLPELGVKDGENGYVFPMEFTDKIDVNKIYNKQLKGTFTYKDNNEQIIKRWRSILGDTTPTHSYKPRVLPKVKVRVLMNYHDIVLNIKLLKDQELEMPLDRAVYLQDIKQFVTII